MMSSAMAFNMRRSPEDLIVELDGKLRSGRIGLQCEAIVGLPAVFDSQPFPTLVNAAFLKMAEVFKTGSNFLRLCIVKIIPQCSDHLRKILSAAEVVRRFSIAMHSNDPVARALALRVFGGLAVITAEQVSVQQSVRQSLEAHEKVEVDAAVFAARCLSAYNAQFAGSVVNKLSARNGTAIAPSMQLELLPTLQYVATQSEAEDARRLCVDLLLRQSSKAQAIAAVRALSQLACSYIVHMSEHVSILLGVLQQDCRQQVCLAVLEALDHMTCKAAHLWQPQHVAELWEFLSQSQSTCLTCAALIVMNSLAWSIIGGSVLDRESLATCQSLCCNVDCTVSSLACAVATGSVLAASQQPGAEVGDRLLDAVCSVRTLLTVICTLQSGNAECHHRSMQLVLSCAVKLAQACPLYRRDLLQAVVDGLAVPQSSQVLLFCRALQRIVAVCSADAVEGVLSPAIPALVQFAVDHAGDTGEGENIAVAIGSLLLSCAPVDMPSVESILAALELGRHQWSLYCVARSAAERGVFQLASRLFSRLSTLVCNEQHIRWLAGLADLCTAEQSLSNADRDASSDLPAILCGSSRFLFQAAAHFGLAKSDVQGVGMERVHFVRQYCHLRSEMLCSVHQVLVTATAVKAAPVLSLSVRHQMEKCLSGLQGVSRSLSELYQSAFNADPQSLLCLQSMANSCDFLVDCCNALYLSKELRPVQAGSVDSKIDALRHAVSQKLGTSDGVLGEEDRFVCVLDIVVQLLSSAVCLPPFIFNNQQGTQVRIALWPTAKQPEDGVMLDARTHMVLRVEGAVQPEGPVVYRNVEMVHIRVSAVHEQAPNTGKAAEIPPPGLNLVKTLKLSDNSFSAEFVLHLVPDVKAVHNVTAEVSVSDTDGIVWTTGPRRHLRVKIDDLSPAQAAREALQ